MTLLLAILFTVGLTTFAEASGKNSTGITAAVANTTNLPFLSDKYKTGFTCDDVVPAYFSRSFSFVNQEYPNYDYPQEKVICEITIPRISVNVCQIRFDFDDFYILGLNHKTTNSTGQCNTDQLEIINSNNSVPLICGENKGQHVYVRYNDSSAPIILRISLDGTIYSKSSPGRRWKIRGTPIMCTEKKDLAPAGCLQYHPYLYGQIRSFNYGDRFDSGYPVDLSYSICFPTKDEFCSVWFYPSVKQGSASFHIGSSFGLGCKYPHEGDFILINGLIWGNTQICGKNFPSIEVRYHPYVINFLSDGMHGGETGFSIDYEYRPCNRSGGRAFSLLSTRYE